MRDVGFLSNFSIFALQFLYNFAFVAEVCKCMSNLGKQIHTVEQNLEEHAAPVLQKTTKYKWNLTAETPIEI